MKRAILCLIFTAAAWPAFAETKVTYADHVLPIFRNACNNCHNPDKKKAGLDLTTYGSTMAGSENGPIVKPGQADSSLLFKVCAQTEEPKMPPKGDKLSDADLATLKNWIAGYALETATSKPAQAAQNQVALAVVSLERPAGPPPLPGDLPLEPYLRVKNANAITALAASPWAPLVAIGGQKQIVLYYTDTLQAAGVLAFPEGFPQIIRFSRNGQLLLGGGGLGGKMGKVVLWNVLTGERVGTVGDEVDQVLAADVSPDHAHVALGGPSKKLKIFSTKDGQLLHTLKKHTDWVTAVAFSPDGRYLASADRNGGIMVWEGASGKEYNPLPGHKLGVTSLSFMPGVLASASTDGKITLWDVKEAKEIRSWTAHNGGVEWIDFTPDGRLVSCGRDRYAKVWDQNGKVLFTSAEFGDIVLRSALNTERVIAADWSGKIRAFSLDGKPLAELTANPASITEQLDFASQRLADAQVVLPGLQQAFQSADQKLKAEREAAEVKRKADIAAAEKTQIAAQAAIESAKANLAALEKRLIEEKAAVEQSKAAHDSANTALDAIAKTLTEKKAANAPDLAAAEQELGQKTAARDEIAKKLEEQKARFAATETEIAKAKEELPKTIAAQEKAIAAAKALFVQLTSPPPEPKPVVDEAKVAAVAKKLEELNAEIARRREERSRFQQGSAEYEKADMAVQAVKPDIAKAETDLAAAKEPALPVPKISPTEIELNKAKAAFEEASAAVAAVTIEVQRLQRAQAYMGVYRAERGYADLKAQHEQLVATAKEALKPAEQLREQIAALEKTRVEGPQKIKEAEAVLTSAVQARDAANKAVGDTQAMIAEKEKASTSDPKAIEAEAAAAAKKLEELNAEIARRREARGKTQQGTPEYQRADAEVQGIKPEIANAEQALAAAKAKMDPNQKPAPSPELVAAREALKKAELDAKLATDKVPPAEKALADLKQALAAGVQKLAELRQTIPAITQQANQTKAKAEQEAAALAKEVDRSKAEATRVRAEFDAKWPRNDQRQAQR